MIARALAAPISPPAPAQSLARRRRAGFCGRRRIGPGCFLVHRRSSQHGGKKPWQYGAMVHFAPLSENFSPLICRG